SPFEGVQVIGNGILKDYPEFMPILWKGVKAAGIHNISAEMLKAGGEAIIHGLHAVLNCCVAVQYHSS
ncbi:hypothetical protein, partial [Escherichia coli]|uniref:hypothetical protein n=1 Tax=Escherichia coli TaxID=562 RepID=UPI00307B0B25